MISIAYRYVIAVARYRNVTKAAAAMNVTQPALTRYLNKVEDELGVRLFDRNVSPVALTAAGERFLEKAMIIAETEDQLLRELETMTHAIHGRVSFGITPEFSASLLPLLLPDFRKKYPEIELDITEDTNYALLRHLERRKIAIAMFSTTTKNPDLTEESVQDDPILLAVPVNHPMTAEYDLSLNSPISPYLIQPERVRKQEFIICAPELGVGAVTRELIHRHRLDPEIVQVLKSNTTALKVASSGLGMTFAPVRTMLRVELMGRMAYFTLDNPVFLRHRVISTRRGEPLSEAETVFCDEVRSLMKNNPAFQTPLIQVITSVPQKSK